ncbi:MAG: amidophosphoribosyltransferase [Muribaculaceae bacterium]|nr:amidophosphoribosyltransferase [Muribaculaceae bacterium]
MEQLKHECGVALIRLLKPLEYFKRKYGSYTYALDRLYLLMEKQHNRGQEAAGVGVVKLNAVPGHEYVFRERALGTGAIDEIFQNIGKSLPANLNSLSPEEADTLAPFIGEIYMGHLRYSTTGRSGIEYTHPFLRRNNWRSRAMMLCGNFNMTNVGEIFDHIVSSGQHPRLFGDTVLLLEQIGNALDKENHRVYRKYRDIVRDPELSRAIERELSVELVLKDVAPLWDGGFVIVGATGSGDTFALRDANGIRPAFYYCNDEIAVLASERPVIRTVFNVGADDVHELEPGCALIVTQSGDVSIKRILPEAADKRCSFERIYFSRGSDEDIYRERKALGANVVPQLMRMIDGNLRDTVFSFIPNTAEVAFIGMVQELERLNDIAKKNEIMELCARGEADSDRIEAILDRRVRIEKIAIKDIKLRTFIAEGTSRNDLAAHVYDVTYGSVRREVDTIVVIDDSIVRGTTLKQSILRILDRLEPARIIVVSSSPQVRYPDYYGIDMPRLEELIAFRAAIRLLMERGAVSVIHDTYEKCRRAVLGGTSESLENHVKAIYAPFSDEEISEAICAMLTPDRLTAKAEILYQTIEGLHKAVPACPGDWYFSGDYPTSGGIRLVNKAFVDYYERTFGARVHPFNY